MCKSQAQGGQRCATDARTLMNASEAKMEAVLDDLVNGDFYAATAAYAAYHEDVKKFASTLDGAAEMRAELAEYAATYNADPERIAATAAIIDDGAKIAHVNREIENAYRATQGQPPLTTPLPQTFAQEAETKAAADQAATEKAAKAADPFGLRTEAAKRGLAAVGDEAATAAIMTEASAEQAALEANTPAGVDPEMVRLRGAYIAALSNMQTVTAAVSRGEADEDDLLDAQEDVVDTMVNFASTNEGAADMYATLHALDPASPDYGDEAEGVLHIIDEGARKAQQTRARENASREAQGLPPLTTPIPQTLDQLQAAALALTPTEVETARQRMEAAGSNLLAGFDEFRQEHNATEAAAQAKADPFGLRST